MTSPDNLDPEDREDLEEIIVKLDEPHGAEKTCNCPNCCLERGELPRPSQEDLEQMQYWANKALDRLPSMRNLDLAVAVASAVTAAVFAGYAVGIGHARREKDGGNVDRGL